MIIFNVSCRVVRNKCGQFFHHVLTLWEDTDLWVLITCVTNTQPVPPRAILKMTWNLPSCFYNLWEESMWLLYQGWCQQLIVGSEAWEKITLSLCLCVSQGQLCTGVGVWDRFGDVLGTHWNSLCACSVCWDWLDWTVCSDCLPGWLVDRSSVDQPPDSTYRINISYRTLHGFTYHMHSLNTQLAGYTSGYSGIPQVYI